MSSEIRGLIRTAPKPSGKPSASLSSLIESQGVGGLYRIYATTQRDGVDFNLAFVPQSFDRAPAEPFDRQYMNELFRLGYDMARSGYPWTKSPPGY